MHIKRTRRHRIRNIIRLNWTEFVRSPKLYLILFSYICIVERSLLPMLRLSDQIGEALNIVEPFIAFCNSKWEALLIPLTYLVIFCDYPRSNSHYTYTIVRAGRANWIWGNCLFAMLVSTVYMGSIFVMSLIVCQKQSFVFNGWSLYTRKMKYYYSTQLMAFGEDKVLDAGLYMHYRPYEALGYTLLLNILMGLTISSIFLLCNVLQKHNLGMICNVLLLVGGWITNQFLGNIMWIFPYANCKLGWHHKYILRETILTDGYSVAYFVILILILYGFLFWKIRRTPIYVSDNL